MAGSPQIVHSRETVTFRRVHVGGGGSPEREISPSSEEIMSRFPRITGKFSSRESPLLNSRESITFLGQCITVDQYCTTITTEVFVPEELFYFFGGSELHKAF